MTPRCLLALALLAGCDDLFNVAKVTKGPADATLPIDAALDPCAPTAVVPTTIHISGTFLDSTNSAPLASLAVNLIPGGQATTDATGTFSIDAAANGMPYIASLTASGSADHPVHHIYYERPFTMELSDASSKLLSNAARDSLYTNGPRMSTHATALISLRDCLGAGSPGATVSIDPPSDVVYEGAGTVTNTTGVAYADLPEGTSVIHSTVSAPFTVTAQPGEMLIVYLLER